MKEKEEKMEEINEIEKKTNAKAFIKKGRGNVEWTGMYSKNTIKWVAMELQMTESQSSTRYNIPVFAYKKSWLKIPNII